MMAPIDARRVVSLPLLSALVALTALTALTALDASAWATVPTAVTSVRPLTAAGPDAHRPRFSPDARRLAWHAGPDGKADVWVMDLAGGAPRQLTDDAADDREPSWTPDGAAVVFASNRDGDYDLWKVAAAGGAAERVTNLEGDEREPAVSPLRFTFYAVYEDGCSRTGVDAEAVDQYGKIAFTRDGDHGRAVWFVSDNGKHKGRLSPADDVCHSPSWSADGLSLAWACERGGATVVVDGGARWEQDFATALKALGADEADGCEDWEPDQWESDACQTARPRRYARFVGIQRSEVDDALAAPAYSANQTILLATAPGAGRGVQWRPRGDDGRWQPFPASVKGAVAAVWAPDGRSVVVETRGSEGPSLHVAATDFYLQEVRDLIDFPELWGAGASSLLQANRFVARPGSEREFHTHYEKLGYRRRAVFVTADAALQVFHDEFTSILREAEDGAAEDLLALSSALMDRYAARYAASKADDDRWYAVFFAVPTVFLKAAAEVKTTAADDSGWVDPDAPQPPPAMDQILAAIPRALEAVPEPIRAATKVFVDKALAHEAVDRMAVPGEKDPIPIDWSQFKVRGHYATSPLAGYFFAVMWYGNVPLPLLPETFALEAALHAPAADGEDEPLAARWDRIDALVGAFMGRPVDASFTHVRAIAREKPALLKKFDRAAVGAELARLRGPIPFRGLSGALDGKTPLVRVHFLPRRYGLDVEFFTKLTHPDVPLRAVPSALDVLAALGVERAREYALAREKGAAWYAKYEETLSGLAAENAKRPAAYWATDLYHGWLALVVTLASQPDVPTSAGLPFARTRAWADRLLHSGLAGYTKLKHQAILYAFQDYSAECDSERPLKLFVEQPILAPPRGFVDPHPAFFARLATLAEALYEKLHGGEAPSVNDFYGRFQDPDADTQESVPLNAAVFARRLEALAKKEVRGEALGDADHRWLLQVAPMMEAMFLGQSDSGAMQLTGDEGRTKTGVAVVADVHTAVEQGMVVEEAIGRLLDLYVVVPDTVGQRLTEGALFSYFEFLQPMAQRLDDLGWSARLDQGDVPPPPPWTTSFLEIPGH